MFRDSSLLLFLKCCLGTWLELEEREGLYGFYIFVDLVGEIRLSAWMLVQLGTFPQGYTGPADVLGLSFWLLFMAWSLWLAWDPGSPACLFQYRCGFYQLKALWVHQSLPLAWTGSSSAAPASAGGWSAPEMIGFLASQLALKSVFMPLGNATSQTSMWCALTSPSGFYSNVTFQGSLCEITSPQHFLFPFLL